MEIIIVFLYNLFVAIIANLAANALIAFAKRFRNR